MSTEYFVTNKERKKSLMKSEIVFKDFLEKAKVEVTNLIAQIPPFEGSENVKEDLTCDVCRKFDLARFDFPDIQEDCYCIGTATSFNFHWRTDNGFYAIRSVKEFLKKHPDFQLEDEYSIVISIKEFEEMVERRQYLK